MHKNQPRKRIGGHLIKYLADAWRDDGLEVAFVFGVDRFVPADLVIAHVDLSVVPDEYLEFAGRYPIVLNGEVKDIRKSTFSEQRVSRNSGYVGKVIVKSNLNHGGRPERRLLEPVVGSVDADRSLDQIVGRGRFPMDYPIYDRIEDVPGRFFATDDFIVEKFIPEWESGRYHARWFDFLGDCWTSLRSSSTSPVCRTYTRKETETIEPPPKLFELRKRFRLDYGKLDYVVHDGAVHLLDVNKTTGAFARPRPVVSRHLAAGIYSYLH
jgi:hypothetical protein